MSYGSNSFAALAEETSKSSKSNTHASQPKKTTKKKQHVQLQLHTPVVTASSNVPVSQRPAKTPEQIEYEQIQAAIKASLEHEKAHQQTVTSQTSSIPKQTSIQQPLTNHTISTKTNLKPSPNQPPIGTKSPTNSVPSNTPKTSATPWLNHAKGTESAKAQPNSNGSNHTMTKTVTPTTTNSLPVSGPPRELKNENHLGSLSSQDTDSGSEDGDERSDTVQNGVESISITFNSSPSLSTSGISSPVPTMNTIPPWISKIESMEQRLSALERQNVQLENNVSSLSSSNSQLEHTLSLLRSQLGHISSENTMLKAQIQDLQNQLHNQLGYNNFRPQHPMNSPDSMFSANLSQFHNSSNYARQQSTQQQMQNSFQLPTYRVTQQQQQSPSNSSFFLTVSGDSDLGHNYTPSALASINSTFGPNEYSEFR